MEVRAHSSTVYASAKGGYDRFRKDGFLCFKHLASLRAAAGVSLGVPSC